jgi:DHA1 family tetracycline resistance protein-like MFS transporter
MILKKNKVLLISNFGTLISWIIFLIAFFLPVANIFSINSAIIGTFVITLPIVVLFFARSLDEITGGNVSVANAYILQIFLPRKIEVKTLEKWQYHPILALLLVLR